MYCEYCGEELLEGVCINCSWYEETDDSDFSYDYEDEKYRENEERLMYAHSCKCGAWKISNGVPIHVADCCCGAE